MKIFNKKIKKCYFIGIGGKGMSPLAQFMASQNIEVMGYDQKRSNYTSILEQNSIRVFYEQDPERVEKFAPDLIVYTPAINDKTNKELSFVLQSDLFTLKRADVIGEITKSYKTISISGTHGKTSTSAMLAHILNNCETKTTSLIGGVIKNYNSGFINGKSDLLLLEADEYDKSFVKFQSFGLLITSIEADHLDTYGNFDNLIATFIYLISTIPENGFISYCYDRKDLRKFVKNLYCKNIINYSVSNNRSDYYTRNIQVLNNSLLFDIYHKDKCIIKNAELAQTGMHNIENAIGAISVAHYLGVSKQVIKDAISSFLGVGQRWDIGFRNERLLFISDYAHHPTEVSTTIKSLRSQNKDKRILVIFHPHLYSRTKDHYLNFAASLDLADSVAILPIYPAREEPIPGITSKLIFDKLKIEDKFLLEMGEVLSFIDKRAEDFDIIIALGAGNISDYFQDIINILKSKFCYNFNGNDSTQ